MRGGEWLGLLRGAKKIEWIVLIAVVAAVLLAALGPLAAGGNGAPVPTDMENRVAAVLSQVENAGRVQVLIGEGDEAGVLVVAEGADDLRVAMSLASAVQTLLGVENRRIEVLKMDKGG